MKFKIYDAEVELDFLDADEMERVEAVLLDNLIGSTLGTIGVVLIADSPNLLDAGLLCRIECIKSVQRLNQIAF